MSNTPETDDIARGNHVVPTEWAKQLEVERNMAQKELSSIHRWIERNHADGFIDSLTYPQNLERVTDNWHDRFDKLERELKEARKTIDDSKMILKAEEHEPLFFASLRVASDSRQWREIAEELCDAAAYGVAQLDGGLSYKACKQIGEAIFRFRQKKKDEEA